MLVGRDLDLERLLPILDLEAEDAPELLRLHGLPGIGKSTLLRQLVRTAQARGLRALHLDCRTVEPTERGFLGALQAAGWDPAGGGDLLVLDHHEHFLLLDTTLRAWFEGAREHGLRLVLCGRRLPGPAWSTCGARLRDHQLEGLDREASLELLDRAGLDPATAREVQAFAQGHPLALGLGVSAARRGAPGLERLELPEVVHRLTATFLEDVPDGDLRRALEACSTVRRVTAPLLARLLEREDGEALYRTLADSPLVEVRGDGLSLHPTVQAAVSSWLHTSDPARFTAHRRRAWQALRDDGPRMAAGDLWRYTADVIYLLEDPIVREAFFPTRSPSGVVEPARPADHDAILALHERHDGATGRDLAAHWLEALPGAHHVVRDAGGAVVGTYTLFDATRVRPSDLERDPLVRGWVEGLPEDLRGLESRVLFLRRWLALEEGDAPGPVQAQCWLDVKRAYLEARPLLRRVHLAVRDLTPYAPAARKLGFRPLGHEPTTDLHAALLDMGPGSVDGWLARLVGGELGIEMGPRLDADQHALFVDGERVDLTPRELAVMGALTGAEGAVVGRGHLLEVAWDGGHSVGSNVVEVLVRGLRRKLGEHAGRLVTVRGAGYRWDA